MKKMILYGGGSDFNLVFFFFLKLCREKIYKNFNKKISDFKLVNKILDIYNDLGTNYNPEPEEKKNLYDVYIFIYC